MYKKLHVAFVSAEVAPYAKSGELADVASSLPKHLVSLGVKTSVFMPKYRGPEIESLFMENVSSDLMVPMGEKKVKSRVYKSEFGKSDIYFIDNPSFFWRDHIYGTGRGDYLDNDERFIFFNRAVLEFLLKAKLNVDIIHCNNWPTALIPVFLKTHYEKKRFFKNVATVLTLHNIAYQGEFPPEALAMTGLNWNYFNPNKLSLNGKFNFLKAGVVFSDSLTTVSSTYKRSILSKGNSFGLDTILKKRKDSLISIRNGIDYESWNPVTDPYIASNYSIKNINNKKNCKKNLVQELSLSLHDRTPLVGIISYLTSHKGLDILVEAMDELMEMDVGIIISGNGDEDIVSTLIDYKKKYPKRVAVKTDSSIPLFHKVVAGLDIILIPSRYEPCGLNQMYGFRYGTVPVVRATGGLAELVKPYNPKTRKGNGFIFQKYTSKALLEALRTALYYYKKPRIWEKILKAGFDTDNSWEKAAKKYVRLYRNTLELKKGG